VDPKHARRFESKVDRSGGPDACHPWTAGRTCGYGKFDVRGKTLRANRIALELKLGRPIAPGMEALHTCDHRECCNPAHLYEGTHQQNMDDKTARGRCATGDRHGSRTHPNALPRGSDHHWNLRPELRVVGERHGSAKLTENQVRQIRQLDEDGITQPELAAYFGVSRTQIRNIVRKKGWKHLL
jgi:hypothetical protein